MVITWNGLSVTDDILDIIADEQVLGKPTEAISSRGNYPATLYAQDIVRSGKNWLSLLLHPKPAGDETGRIY